MEPEYMFHHYHYFVPILTLPEEILLYRRKTWHSNTCHVCHKKSWRGGEGGGWEEEGEKGEEEKEYEKEEEEEKEGTSKSLASMFGLFPTLLKPSAGQSAIHDIKTSYYVYLKHILWKV